MAIGNYSDVFASSEGRIESIEIVGTTPSTAAEIPGPDAMSSKVGQKLQDSSLQHDIQSLYRTGYFKRVEALPNRVPDRGFQLRFVCEEYPTINAIIISGNVSISSNILLDNSPLRVGDVLNTRKTAQLIDQIESTYRARGFDLARVVQSILVTDRIVLIYVSEGTISEIDIDGIPTKLKPVILREIKSHPGGYFNTAQLRSDRERILKLGYFSDVDPPRLDESSEQGRVKVIFGTRPRKINILDAGLEYYEQTGQQPLTGFVRTDFHHLLIPSDVISLKLQGAWHDSGAYLQGYAARYTQPWLLNQWPISISLGGWSEVINEFLTKDRNNSNRLSFSNRRVGVDLGVRYPLSNLLSLGSVAKVEDVFPDSTSQIDPYKLRSIGCNLEFTTVSNVANPRNGVYSLASYEIGGKIGGLSLGGLVFTRWVTTLAGFIEIASSDVLATRVVAGCFTPEPTNGFTFENEGFDLGGSNTIRGYKESFPIFVGNKELLMNIEWRHDFTPTFQGVVFWDTGRAFSTGWSTSFNGFLSGWGVGLRAFTPIGPLRIDLALGESYIIHFGLGQTF